eukprot:TRINITY_DN71415_c0_g1_i1.p1 TRINITY_DN71415_c0_g1~~TRINITY_DN71415_c0_g1_i1.p1  ORF type:complete len:526 (+),score=124.88 TRINITY_DN71415_c0_g1_i1:92-1579(+)
MALAGAVLLPAIAAQEDGANPDEYVEIADRLEDQYSGTIWTWVVPDRLHFVAVAGPNQVSHYEDLAAVAMELADAEAADEVAYGFCPYRKCDRGLRSLQHKSRPPPAPPYVVALRQVGKHSVAEWYNPEDRADLRGWVEDRLRVLRMRSMRHSPVNRATAEALRYAGAADGLGLAVVVVPAGAPEEVWRERHIAARQLATELATTRHGGPTGSVVVLQLDAARDPGAAETLGEMLGTNQLPPSGMAFVTTEGKASAPPGEAPGREDYVDALLEFTFGAAGEEVPGHERSRKVPGLTRREFHDHCQKGSAPCLVLLRHRDCPSCDTVSFALDDLAAGEGPRPPGVLLAHLNVDRHPDILADYRGATYVMPQAVYRDQQVEHRENVAPSWADLQFNPEVGVRSDGHIGPEDAPIVLWYEPGVQGAVIVPLPHGHRSIVRSLRRFAELKLRHPGLWEGREPPFRPQAHAGGDGPAEGPAPSESAAGGPRSDSGDGGAA